MTETFDWKGEGGDKFATMNPSDVEGTDAHFVDYFNVTVTSVFNDVCDVLAQKGKELKALSYKYWLKIDSIQSECFKTSMA